MESLSDRFQALRTTIEAMAGANAVVIVAGACERDGADAVVRGLAVAYGEAGSNVVLMSDRSSRARLAKVTVLPIMSMVGVNAAKLNARFAQLRAEYDVVLIDVPVLFERSLDAELARRSDGVVLAIEQHRRITAHDSQIAAMLDRLSVRRLGVVMTKPDLHASVSVSDAPVRHGAALRKPSAQRT
ncbi:MAG: hypothetical protein NVS2B8_18260 [Vulcanimicrobiaceae bacterium]